MQNNFIESVPETDTVNKKIFFSVPAFLLLFANMMICIIYLLADMNYVKAHISGLSGDGEVYIEIAVGIVVIAFTFLISLIGSILFLINIKKAKANQLLTRVIGIIILIAIPIVLFNYLF